MMYFSYKLSDDKGTSFGKTSGSNVESVLKNIMDYELCPKSAIRIKEVPATMMSFPSDQLWKLYERPFKVKMVNRRAVKILEYIDAYSVRVKYI